MHNEWVHIIWVKVFEWDSQVTEPYIQTWYKQLEMTIVWNDYKVASEMLMKTITRVFCEWFRYMYKVSRFESVDRDCVLPTVIECNNKIPFFAINHSERTIMSWLQEWSPGIPSDKHMSAVQQFFVNKGGLLWFHVCWLILHTLHSFFQTVGIW